MSFRPSITIKLLLGFLGLLVLALVFLGTVSTLWFVREQSANLDRFLDSEARGVANRLEGIVEGFTLRGSLRGEEVREALSRDLSNFLSQRVNRPIPYKTTVVILDDRGLPLARSNSAIDLSDPAPVLAAGEVRIEDIHDRGPAYRVVTATYALGTKAQGTFQIACLLSSQEVPLANFLTSLFLVLGGSLVLLSFLGIGLIRLTLSPVRTMSRVAGQISEQNLGARIPLPPGRDDLAQLAATLNGLLSRLEDDYAYQERLVGELTHQLKTPLTILRGRNELGLTTRRTVAELRELVEDNLSDIDALVNLLNTLLELARLDSRIDRVRSSPVDVKRLVGQLEEEMEPLWVSKGLVFVAEGEAAVVEADPEGFRQVLMNLYDNAWKFSPPGGRLSTRWETVGDAVRIVVSNQGPPIPEEDLERIFRRFYRSPEAPDGPGAGLGLSVVRSLVGLHGGTIRAFNPPEGGAAFEILWPYASSR